MSKQYNRILLTGAAGALGSELRPRLKPYCQVLRLSDLGNMGTAQEGEEVMSAELQDRSAIVKLLEGVDAVVHLGGISTEKPFDDILQANIIGAYNLFEAARINGIKRVIFASSNHVTGFYRQDEVIDGTMPVRPDSYYGLSKAFGENLARFYFDRYGLETVCLRIGSSFPKPKDRRMLSTWLSYDDLERLVSSSLMAPEVGFSVIYGVSGNKIVWWDNSQLQHIGYRPLDSSESYRTEVEAKQLVLDLNDPAVIYQGGDFVKAGPF
jgi:uronate dehydrogenase